MGDERAERAILSHAEAYRLVEEARQMRAERDAFEAELIDLNERLIATKDELAFQVKNAADAHRERARQSRRCVLHAGINCLCADLEAEVERLRVALNKAAGQLGYLSTVLKLINKDFNAKGALEWSEEARRAAE